MSNEFGQISEQAAKFKQDLAEALSKAPKIDKNFAVFINNQLSGKVLDSLFIAEISSSAMDVITEKKVNTYEAVRYFLVGLVIAAVKSKSDVKSVLKYATLEMLTVFSKKEWDREKILKFGIITKRVKGQTARFCLRSGMTWAEITESMSGLWHGYIEGMNNIFAPNEGKFEVLKEVENSKHWDRGYLWDYFFDSFWP